MFFLRLVGAFLMCAFSMCLPWLWLCLSLVSSSTCVCAMAASSGAIGFILSRPLFRPLAHLGIFSDFPFATS